MSDKALTVSRKHLPEPLQGLMINEDSPILDFYPADFDIDMNGKKMAWQGVALLPFIDQTRLLTALSSKEEELTDDEKRRNRWGDNVMFVAESNRLYDMLCGLYTLKSAGKVSLCTFRILLTPARRTRYQTFAWYKWVGPGGSCLCTQLSVRHAITIHP